MMKRLFLLTLFASSSALAEEPDQRTFEFTYVAELEVPEGSGRVQMWLPYPKSDDYQDVRLLSIKSPVPTKLYQEYSYRNSMLFLSMPPDKLEGLDRLDRLRVEMSFRVIRREHAERDFVALEDPDGWIESSASRWLRPDRLVPLDDFIRDQAEEVTEGKTTVVEKAKAIFDYTVDNLEYDKSGTGWGQGDIYYACDKKRGNCTDFHAVFIGFARAVGIPAKFQIGFPIPTASTASTASTGRREAEIAGYHCWAEFYVPGFGWVPVDTSQAHLNPDKRDYFFGAHDANRIEFTVGRDITLNPKQSVQPLNYFIYPYAEIDGKPVGDVRRQFFYKDLDLVAE